MLSTGVHDSPCVLARASARVCAYVGVYVQVNVCVCVCVRACARVCVCSGGVGMLNKYYAKSLWTKAADISQ